MISFIVAVILTLLCLAGITLRKTYTYLPSKELKRQARSGDPLAGVLYKAAAYGPNLRLLLWAFIGLSAAGSFTLLARIAPPWIGFVAITLVLIYGFAWLPSGRLTSFGAHLAMWLTPPVVWLLVTLHPVLRLTAHKLGQRRDHVDHSGLYELDDIADLLENQKKQSDSRISEDTLNILLHTLHYTQLSVGDVLVPRHTVTSVHESDTIGPILMDELATSGHQRFPVLNKDKELVGILHLQDVLENTHGDTVGNVMQANLHYIHEDHPLEQALHAMLSTGQSLLVVINSKEEYVGIIGIEDVVEQIIGHRLTSEFDQYDNRAAVAAHTTEQLIVPEAPVPEEVAPSDDIAEDIV